MSNKIELRPYQQRDIDFAVKAMDVYGAAAIWAEMGLGKTLMAIAVMSRISKEHPGTRFLLLAPKAVAVNEWPKQIQEAKDSGLCTMSVALAVGTPKQRMAALRKHAQITIINNENVQWLDRLYGYRKWPWRGWTIDEIQNWKSPRSQRFRVLARRRKEISAALGLTGTPYVSSIEDLWAEARILDGGVSLGRYVTHFRQRYEKPGASKGNVVYQWIALPGARKQVDQLISRWAKAETLGSAQMTTKMPTKVRAGDRAIDIPVAMPEATRKLYTQMRETMTMEVQSGELRLAANAGVRTGKLCQMCEGIDTDENGKAHILDTAKIDALKRLVRRLHGEHILVFYWYRQELKTLRKALKHGKDSRDKNAVKDWNDGKLPILFAQPRSAGSGLNLQAGGHVIVWLSLPWSMADWQQANARLDRMGQKHAVTVYRIVEPHTIDMRKISVVEGRQTQLQAVMSELGAGPMPKRRARRRQKRYSQPAINPFINDPD